MTLYSANVLPVLEEKYDKPSISKSVLYRKLHSSRLSTVTSPLPPDVPLQLVAADKASSAVVRSSGEISAAILKALARGESGFCGSVWVTSIADTATMGKGKGLSLLREHDASVLACRPFRRR